MHRALSLHEARWHRSAQTLQNLLILVVLTPALIVSLLALAYRSASITLRGLTHYVALVGVGLHFVIALLLTVRIAHAASIWKNLRSQDEQTAELRQLRQMIFNTTSMIALMLLLAVSAACISLVMRLVMQLPELGLVFGFLLITVVLQRANINRSARQLRDAISAADRCAQRTITA